MEKGGEKGKFLVELLRSEGQVLAAEKVDRFLGWFVGVRPESVGSVLQWNQLLLDVGIPWGWEDRLEFVEVLGLFGVPEDVARKICAAPSLKAGKTTDQYVIRWLSKALNCYKLDGCIVDAVNLIVAIMGGLVDGSVVATIDALTRLFDDLDFRMKVAWIPHVLVMDSELDDLLTMILVKRINARAEIITQVPLEESPMHPPGTSIALKLPGDAVLSIKFFVDPHSVNAKNFLLHFDCKDNEFCFVCK